MSEQHGPVVVIAGATSATGVACAQALEAAGARVIAVGSSIQRLEERLGFATARYACDLRDLQAVTGLAQRIATEQGPADMLLHLVGGWRGGGSLAGQNDEDWDFLHSSVLTTLRNTTRAFSGQLLDSKLGRLAIVSSQSVDNPTPSNASYGAVKAAAEHWTRSVARLFAKQSATASAVIWIVKALSALPEDQVPAGHTPASAVAQAAVDLLDPAARELNGTRWQLATA